MPLSASSMVNKEELLGLIDEANAQAAGGAAGRPLAAEGA